MSLFQKNNNLGNFFKNVLRLVSAILGGPSQCIALHPIFTRMPIGALRQELRMAAASDPVLKSVNAFEKITQTERGRPSSNRAKSVQDFLLRAWRVSPCTTRSRGTRRAPHISWRDFPIRHEPHRLELSFPKRNHHPPYKSRGCAMTEPAIRPALLPVYAYSV